MKIDNEPGRTCPRHGYYLNVNGCPDCNAWKLEKVEKAKRGA